ncbi:PTS transporter subunit EIIC [Enterococcus casseliflavus]|uniref:PTS sugar transporter subunit IIC n=1 Tax=Enterococcus casseliflavus TaxID=37734 RepID=UPI00232F6414|nr:PTS transporter subunit EIIC [Enterococcus casseliflavus]MDB1694043.1 PTS transporter subunit EIIC [Enterococcus casseliflavus]MDB1697188.1 PTS transporter subunit EIIC [Enterococcus casseliflavus]MDB1701414.1 PTS transporter subunit EIIC [Enterococcus casseliflavus]MDB1704862.1 PTS transporter subunit EIIC [Enterococcus casseliflavus]
MKKIEQKIERILPTMNKISNNNYLQAISRSMMATLTITLVGSIAVLLIVFPMVEVKDFVASSGLIEPLMTVNQFTIGSLAVYISFLVAKNLVQQFDQKEDGSRAGLLSLVCFLILTPLTTSNDGSVVLSFEWLGASGVFTAMFTGLIVARFFVFAEQKGFRIKLPDTVPPMVRQNFDVLVPGVFLIFGFMLLKFLFSATTFDSVHQAIYSLIQTPLKGLGGNIWSIVIIATIDQVFWFFGLHGTNLTLPIVQPLWMAMDAENLQAAAAGLPLPNDVGYAFFVTYTYCATAIGFTVLMLMAKSARYKALGKITFPAAIFGISEPLVFGTPLVLNFTFAIPFIFANAVVLIVSYAATVVGLIPPLIGATPIFGLPLGFHAAIQGSWKIVFMQICTQLIGTAIWFPFFKKADNEAYQLEQTAKDTQESL